MAGDGDGFYGYAEAIKKKDWAAERAARSQATPRWRQIDMGNQPSNNPSAVRRGPRARNCGITVAPMAPRMLKPIGTRDCHIRVQGNTRMALQRL